VGIEQLGNEGYNGDRYVARADAYLAKGDFEHASADYQHALGMAGAKASTGLSLGLALALKGDLEGARKAYPAAAARADAADKAAALKRVKAGLARHPDNAALLEAQTLLSP
jgi:tetratricopeptide (TPR) repeat protein